MPLSRRYTPEHAPLESCSFGLDYSFILPVGVGITAGSVQVWTNSAAAVPAPNDWIVGPVMVRARAIYANFTGGVEGTDYQIRWIAVDTEGNTWPRTTLVLCAHTS